MSASPFRPCARALRCLAIITIGVLAAGCADDDDDAQDETSSTEPIGTAVLEEEAAGDAYADVVCPSLFACGCEDPHPLPPYADEQDCRDSMAAEFVSLRTWAQDQGLTYDGECAATRLSYLEDHACDSPELIGHPGCTEHCDLYIGSLEAGESCEVHLSDNWHIREVSNCESALLCFSGVCADETQYPESGCYPKAGPGEDCGGFDKCVDGYFCDQGSCSPRVGEGAACTGIECMEDTYCHDSDLVCTAKKNEGDTCVSGYECWSSLCQNPGDMTCEAPQPLVCELYAA